DSVQTCEVEPGGLLVLESGEIAFLLVSFSQFSTEETFSWRVDSDLAGGAHILLDGESRAVIRAKFGEEDIAGTLLFEVRREDQAKDYRFHVLIRGRPERPRVEIPSFPEPRYPYGVTAQVGWEDSPRRVEFGSTLRLDRGQIAAVSCPGWYVFENPFGAYRTLVVGRDKFYLIAVDPGCEKLLFYDREDEPESVYMYVIVDP
ncbi:hypothetical protein L6258_02255, partial [Candidatus Parcubacteria bacterium]|nr:hypothetical protein [Candidatus Parcubacteria bacterium]